MDRLTCDIVRDLMPLVLDDIASADSKKGVEEHIQNCETCRAYYEGMSIQISRAMEPASDKGFKQFVRGVKRRDKIKKILVACLAVLLVGIIGIFGFAEINGMRYTYDDMSIEHATAQMYLDRGDVVMLDIQAYDEHGIYWYREDVHDCGDDEIIVYLMPVEPRLRWGNRGSEHVREKLFDYFWKDGQLYRREETWNGYSGMTEITDFKVLSLRWGLPEENIVLYDAGDVPPDSPEGEMVK